MPLHGSPRQPRRNRKDASVNSQDKCVGGGNDPVWPIPRILQRRSGGLVQEETAPLRGRRSQYWGCQVTSVRTAIPLPGALRGSVAFFDNITAFLECAATRIRVLSV